MDLQQQSLQAKLSADKKFKELESKYHNDIEKVREQYSKQMQNELKKVQEQRSIRVRQKKTMQTRIIGIQQQSQLTLYELQQKKDDKIHHLLTKITKLQRDYDTARVNEHNLKNQLKDMQVDYDRIVGQIKKSQAKVSEYMSRVKLLESQIQKKNKMVDQRNSLIEHQGEQIGGLEKAKYVLSFRTTQIRKELEPKEALIQKLKEALFKQDEQYKQKTETIFELQRKLQKVQKLAENTKKQLQSVKYQLKAKDRTHEDLCKSLTQLINYTDPKQWNDSIVKIYKKFIKEEKYADMDSKKKDKTSEEINRHLMHVEQSLLHVSTGNQKALQGRKVQVKRKMFENAELVYDLNNMRKRENQLEKELKDKNTEIDRLRRELTEHTKSTRNTTAHTGVTRRQAFSRGQKVNMNDNSTFDINMRRASDYLIPDKSRRSNRVLSANRTVMFRQDKKQKNKVIGDLARELQSSKNTIRRQDRMIQQLNQRLLGLPEDVLL